MVYVCKKRNYNFSVNPTFMLYLTLDIFIKKKIFNLKNKMEPNCSLDSIFD